MSQLWGALCLVAVIEGLILFAAPGLWKRTAEQMLAMPTASLRRIGGVVLLLGVTALVLVRGAG
ncbi:DUF2065 family protein [Luteimonas sp. FCS-9]|uniref:DUF2065 domain-containing protein n=1 Tax=Luteimonas sp. FCS-9 TaxID=1547516 RepID=UPI00063E7E07|nr:DUF2065 family protein [Luteimonas sp. FCS-9]KLI97848.1 membrane protein [Luteimonas sp. FCS-9]